MPASRENSVDPIRILLVDDNQTFLRTAGSHLQSFADLQVVGAADSAGAALALASELQPHVVLLDLQMPDLPGLELIPQLRARLPWASIVILTLHDLKQYREAALAAGADAFVAKRSLLAELAPAIRRMAQVNCSQSKPAGDSRR